MNAIEAMHYTMNKAQLKLENINQNIANIHTPAYKRQLSGEIRFEQILNPARAAILQTARNTQVLTQGSLKETSQPTHLALSDAGFFQIQTETGACYTRKGDFHINDQGMLVTQAGNPVLGTGGSIQVDDKPFQINAAGEIFIAGQKADQLALVQFDHPETLHYLGEGLFQSTENPKPLSGTTRVLQGYLEESNIKTLEEMSDLMQTSRHFQTAQRVFHAADNMTSTAINQLGASNV